MTIVGRVTIGRSVLDWVFPSRCAGCGVAAAGICDRCLGSASRVPAGLPPVRLGLDALVAPYAYEGAVRTAITRVKYRNDRAALRRLAAVVASELGGLVLGGGAVTWVPTTDARRRERGFDHAELLARALARRLGLPARRLLQRVDDRAQTGRTRLGRREGPKFAVRAGMPVPHTVVVVDDVVTTGTSLGNAAATLRRQGCKTVIGAAVARTLLKHVVG